MANISLDMLGGVNLNNNINPDILQLNGNELWSAENYSRGLEYTYSGDYATLAGIGTCEDVDIIVPEKVNYNGKSYSVGYITNNAFYNVKFVNSIKLPNSLIRIEQNAFHSSSFHKIYFPENKIEIRENAFYNCQYLKSVYIPNIETWLKIGFGYNNSNPLINGADLYVNNELLTELIIPESITQIGKNSFRNCTSLTKVVIHNNVTYIGDYAFNNCVNLKEIICYSTTPPTLSNSSALYNPNLERIYVPAESVTIYKNADEWSYLWDKIFAIGDDESLNYTGIDANGNMEGQLAYNGTPVAYAIGKPNIEYYHQVVPTPTTQEGYYNNIIQTNAGFITLNESNFDTYAEQIIIGETPCYQKSSIKEGASAETSPSYKECNGYNSEFYGGYDFAKNMEAEEEYIVPEELVVQETHGGLPIVEIFENAFSAGLMSTQARNIKKIKFNGNSNIESLGQSCFSGLINFSNDIELPPSLKEIGSLSFSSIANSQQEKLITATIPESVTTIGGGVFGSWGGNKIIYKAKNAQLNVLLGSGALDCSSSTTIIFENTVESLSGYLFQDNTKTPQTLVFKHSQDAQISFNLQKLKTATAITIYTDNTIVQNFGWATNVNITPTFKPLSEYTG